MVEENYGANFRAVEVENSRIKEVLGQRSRRYNLLPGNAPSNAADLCLGWTRQRGNLVHFKERVSSHSHALRTLLSAPLRAIAFVCHCIRATVRETTRLLIPVATDPDRRLSVRASAFVCHCATLRASWFLSPRTLIDASPGECVCLHATARHYTRLGWFLSPRTLIDASPGECVCLPLRDTTRLGWFLSPRTLIDASPGECVCLPLYATLYAPRLIPVATDTDRRLSGRVRLFATARHYIIIYAPRLIPVAADPDRRLSWQVRLFATVRDTIRASADSWRHGHWSTPLRASAFVCHCATLRASADSCRRGPWSTPLRASAFVCYCTRTTRLLIPVAADTDRRLSGRVRLFATARHYIYTRLLIPVAADPDRRLSGRVRHCTRNYAPPDSCRRGHWSTPLRASAFVCRCGTLRASWFLSPRTLIVASPGECVCLPLRDATRLGWFLSPRTLIDASLGECVCLPLRWLCSSICKRPRAC